MAVHASLQHVVGAPLRRYCQTRVVADRRACLAKPVDAVVHRSPQIVCARREISNGAENSDGDSANRGTIATILRFVVMFASGDGLAVLFAASNATDSASPRCSESGIVVDTDCN